eukprot:1160335-Pelagomonas_calceolata.AAC.12
MHVQLTKRNVESHSQKYTANCQDKDEVEDICQAQHKGASNDAQAWLEAGLNQKADLHARCGMHH